MGVHAVGANQYAQLTADLAQNHPLLAQAPQVAALRNRVSLGRRVVVGETGTVRFRVSKQIL